jgi:hypothetical protein
MKITISHSKKIDSLLLEEQLLSEDNSCLVYSPRMTTRIVDGQEQPPVAEDGYIEFEDESKAELVQQILDAHDPEAIQNEREAKEAERIAELLARHPEAIEKIETELERRRPR